MNIIIDEDILIFEPGVFERRKGVKRNGRVWNLFTAPYKGKCILLYTTLSDKDLHPYEIHIEPQVYKDGRRKVWFICARHWGKRFVSKYHEKLYGGYIVCIEEDDLFEYLLSLEYE